MPVLNYIIDPYLLILKGMAHFPNMKYTSETLETLTDGKI